MSFHIDFLPALLCVWGVQLNVEISLLLAWVNFPYIFYSIFPILHVSRRTYLIMKFLRLLSSSLAAWLRDDNGIVHPSSPLLLLPRRKSIIRGSFELVVIAPMCTVASCIITKNLLNVQCWIAFSWSWIAHTLREYERRWRENPKKARAADVRDVASLSIEFQILP